MILDSCTHDPSEWIEQTNGSFRCSCGLGIRLDRIHLVLTGMKKQRDEWNGDARRDVARLKTAIRNALGCLDEQETPTAVECLREALGQKGMAK